MHRLRTSPRKQEERASEDRQREAFYKESLNSSNAITPLRSEREKQLVSPNPKHQQVLGLTLDALIGVIALERELEKAKIEMCLVEDFNLV